MIFRLLDSTRQPRRQERQSHCRGMKVTAKEMSYFWQVGSAVLGNVKPCLWSDSGERTVTEARMYLSHRSQCSSKAHVSCPDCRTR